MSKAFNLGRLLGTSGTLDINDVENASNLTGLDVYADSDALAAVTPLIGDQAYREDIDSFVIFDGSSWNTIEFEAPSLGTQAQGSDYGYSAGGGNQSGIDVYPFASETNVSLTPTALTYPTGTAASTSSRENGYSSAPQYSSSNIIQKFSFPIGNSSADVGDLSVGRDRAAGQFSTVSGYTSGGVSIPSITNVIDKFPFATDANATDVGDLPNTSYYSTGQSSATHGYKSGGSNQNEIVKFPFAADANATDVGDLTSNSGFAIGNSSSESGYVSGGTPAGNTEIQKFSFASDGNAANIGDLTIGTYSAGYSSQNSSSHGYVTASTIDKFSFASDGDATDLQITSPFTATGSGHQV